MGLSKNKFGVVICSRLGSKRIPKKAFAHVNGVKVINHLCDRLNQFKVYLSVPDTEFSEYCAAKRPGVFVGVGSADNPLLRMKNTAIDLDYIIRITHDKIFVDSNVIKRACSAIEENPDAGYLYCSGIIDGCGFEIIRKDVLNYAATHYGIVEHISYAAKETCTTLGLDIIKFEEIPPHLQKYGRHPPRLLIDYPRDLLLIRKILTSLGNDCSTESVIHYLENEGNIFARMNELPILTMYTCTYNAAKYLPKCIKTIQSLNEFKEIEYIIIDDASTDRTSKLIGDLQYCYNNIKVITNKKNIGLSSSCNVALEHATSQYIMRLDADDHLLTQSIMPYLNELDQSGADVLTPPILRGKSPHRIIESYQNEHVGGSIFRTTAVNHFKFTEGLRGYDNLDFFGRARNALTFHCSHLPPLFYYRDTPGSLSNSNPVERALIKEGVLDGR